MRHPFQNLPQTWFRGLYWACLALTLLLSGLLLRVAQPLAAQKNDQGEAYSIIQFELARTPDRAHKIVETWGAKGCPVAIANTRLDFLYLLVYSNLIALGILAANAAVYNTAVRKFALALAWAQWFAAACDAIENAALLQILAGSLGSLWAPLAFSMAAIKFALIFAGVAFILIALPLRWRTVPNASGG